MAVKETLGKFAASAGPWLKGIFSKETLVTGAKVAGVGGVIVAGAAVTETLTQDANGDGALSRSSGAIGHIAGSGTGSAEKIDAQLNTDAEVENIRRTNEAHGMSMIDKWDGFFGEEGATRAFLSSIVTEIGKMFGWEGLKGENFFGQGTGMLTKNFLDDKSGLQAQGHDGQVIEVPQQSETLDIQPARTNSPSLAMG